MRLKFRAFENMAVKKGYLCGQDLMMQLGYPDLLTNLALNNNLGYDVVRDLFNELGSKDLNKVIDFEGGNINEFTGKYIAIGRNLI